jgi:putative DNA primase/helicase
MIIQSEKNDTVKENETLQLYEAKSLKDIQTECLSHMAANGIPFFGEIIPDGTIHRFSTDERKNRPDEWYIAFHGNSLKGIPYLNCIYGSWSEGTKFEFKSWSNSNYYKENQEIQESLRKKQIEIEQQLAKDKEERVRNAQRYWKEAKEHSFHEDHTAYLNRKKVKPYGVRFGIDPQGKSSLIIPIYNIEEEIQAVQFISKEGEKRIYGLKKGNFHLIGSVNEKSKIIVVEGFATGATTYEASENPVAVTFDCGNFDAVITNLKAKYPHNQIVIAADNDRETKNNPGKTKAEEVVKKYNCSMILPCFPNDFKLPNGKFPTDFNDLHVHFGLDKVKKQLTGKKPYLTTIDIGNFLSLELPPRNLLLSPWFPEQGLAMIYATRGVGKTFVALSIAYAIASGAKILNWEAEKPRKILYVDGEMPASTMQERVAGIAKSFDKQPPDPSYFRIITPDLQEQGIRDLSTPEGQADIMEHLEDIDVLILDNLSTLVRSGRENDGESWLPIQELALKLRKIGKSVLFVHHAGKGGQQRGSSRKEDILDTVITLKRPKDYSPEDGAKFEVHFEKSRGFDGESAKPFQASLIENNGGIGWKVEALEIRDFDKIIELANDGLTQRDIATEIGKSLGYVNKYIQQGKNAGLIKA